MIEMLREQNRTLNAEKSNSLKNGASEHVHAHMCDRQISFDNHTHIGCFAVHGVCMMAEIMKILSIQTLGASFSVSLCLFLSLSVSRV